ncbi:HAMP domain-containing sensor histidine kinase [Clostridium botulinum]|uniref:HAMP domain-containing sensor histidine kinase n=1 Tax=Clostridium botulinum TaxID=1491 RepID=UPI0006A48AB3|nr:HAMP domain-containing sensor histidine kinase [Clostridium botulinum]KOC32925.1 histidine kinase [Clostridium botulinum]
MKKIKLNIKGKIIITNTLILIPIIVFICVITFTILTDNLLNSSINSLIAESKSTQMYIQNIIDENNNSNINSIIDDYAPYICNELKTRFNFRVQFFDSSQKLLYDTTDNKDISRYYKDIELASRGNKAYIVKKIDSMPYIFMSSPIFYKNNVCGVLRFVFKDSSTYSIVRRVFWSIVVIAILLLLLASILFHTFAKRITNPLIKLTSYSEKIAKGNYDEKLELSSGDEVELLANAFNEMSSNIKLYINELKKSYKNQKDFFDNVSHEFKTPLTSIIGFSDIIPKLDEKEQIYESAYYIKKEGERLLGLVNEILAIAKSEKKSFEISKEFINVDKIIKECISILKPRLNNYHIIVENNVTTYFVYVDYNKTKQVFLNILDNAIKYSGCELITINSYKYEDGIQIKIKDDGIGFDTNNPVSKNSTGFGLKICKDIMNNQHGDFYFKSNLNFGTTCIVTFYKHLQGKL